MSLKHLTRMALMTAVLSTAGLALSAILPTANAQDDTDPYPAPPGWYHTKEIKHSGLKAYKAILYPDGTLKHTGEIKYPDGYVIKPIVPVET